MARDVSKLPNLDKLFWMHLYCGLFSWYQRNGVMDQGSPLLLNIAGCSSHGHSVIEILLNFADLFDVEWLIVHGPNAMLNVGYS